MRLPLPRPRRPRLQLASVIAVPAPAPVPHPLDGIDLIQMLIDAAAVIDGIEARGGRAYLF